jgi:hypothetical protein
MWYLLVLVAAREFVPEVDDADYTAQQYLLDADEPAPVYQSFTETGFPEFQVSNGPMLRARLPFALKEIKYDHAVYKPFKGQPVAGSHSNTWIKLSIVLFAVYVGLQLLLARAQPTPPDEQAVIARGWIMLQQVLPALELRAESAQHDRVTLAEIEAQVQKFEQVLDNLDLQDLVTAKVATLEAATETRKAMIIHAGQILDRIEGWFKPPTIQEVPEPA